MSNFGQEMKNGAQSVKRGLIIANVVVLALGLLMVIFPKASAEIICRVVGIVLMLAGAVRLVFYFRSDKLTSFGSFGLVTGAALVGFGLYFLIKPDFLASFLTAALAILLLVGGVMKLQYGVDLARMKLPLWWLELLGAAIMAVLGIIGLANPFSAASGLMIFLGISLIVDAIWDLISILYVSGAIKKIRSGSGMDQFWN